MRSWILRISLTLALSSSAHAFTTLNTIPGGQALTGEGLVTTHAGSIQERFNSPTAATTCVPPDGLGVVLTGSRGNHYDLATDTLFHRRLAPMGDASCYLTLGSARSTENLVLDFAQASAANPLTYFGLYWGSIDPYNHISFFNGNGAVDFQDGLGGQLDGATVAGLTNVPLYTSNYIEFNLDPADQVTYAIVSTDNYAFEIDNIAYSVSQAGTSIRVSEPADTVLLICCVVAIASLKKFKIAQRRP